MSEKMCAQEDGGFTFTDEDFERRYSFEEDVHSGTGAGNSPRPANQQAGLNGGPVGRSRNKFMRTLLRRRFLSSAPT
jgi:hypothetical protein